MIALFLAAACGVSFAIQHKAGPHIRAAMAIDDIDEAEALTGARWFADRLLACAYCVGFHGGWLAAIPTLVPWLTDTNPVAAVVSPVVGGFAGAAVYYLFNATLNRLEGE